MLWSFNIFKILCTRLTVQQYHNIPPLFLKVLACHLNLQGLLHRSTPVNYCTELPEGNSYFCGTIANDQTGE